MLKKTFNYVMACQYLPPSVRQYVPWDEEDYIAPNSPNAPAVRKKSIKVPVCRHCGLCLTTDKCPLAEEEAKKD